MKTLKYLVIHCTATPAGREVTRKDIEQWHLKERGWSRVGYSDMIHLDGKLENLTDYNQNNFVDGFEITNGARGYNGISRHVVYVGGMHGKDTRTPQQKETLLTYIRFTILRHPNIKVIGHNNIANKACPSFNVQEWLKYECINEKNIG